MTQQAMPFFDSAEAASSRAIQDAGKSIKEVAKHLWPGRSWAAAQTLLSNCLNATRDEKLTADEHIAIAKFCQRFDYLYYTAHRLSHTRPVLVTPAERQAELQALLFSKADDLQVILDQIRQINPRAPAEG